ncbi:McrC family protein [Ilumatobacter nonamiensis]|uniref:McrC family protein n=1 Tax=Ilumatobacter nonamiensis TaxID=467093 RepID=UPI0003467395|nr:hypothetical protein [Ilumatobacter nonamiensis]
MIEVEVVETGPGRTYQLTNSQAGLLQQSKLVTVRLGVDGAWEVSGAGKVGVARIGDMVVRARPKVSIHRLFYLLGYGRNLAWRDDLVPYDSAAGLVHVIAESFARQADRALGRGLIHGYVERDDELAVVRGRLRSTEQVTRRFSQITPLLVRYDDFTPDVAENRILKAASRVLHTLPDLDAQVRRQLRTILDRLAAVTDLPFGAPLPTWRPNRRNTHYETSLWFADLVLRHHSVDLPPGSIEINGFMVDMPKVFEDFVTIALSSSLEGIDGHVVAQDPHTLDAAGRVQMNPDLVWHRGGQPVAVIDAKYKAEKPAGYPNADLYQLLAYCTALGLPEGHLVYAKGAEDPAVHVVRRAGVRLVAHAVDLDQPTADLERDMSALAGRIVLATRTNRADPDPIERGPSIDPTAGTAPPSCE